MKTKGRVALVVALVAAYACILAFFLLVTIGADDVQTIGELVRGDRCHADCGPRFIIATIAFATIPLGTMVAVIWIGIVWVRRRAQQDQALAEIDTWLATAPPVTAPDPPAEPEPQRFYRDRQGRLRPLKSAGEDD